MIFFPAIREFLDQTVHATNAVSNDSAQRDCGPVNKQNDERERVRLAGGLGACGCNLTDDGDDGGDGDDDNDDDDDDDEDDDDDLDGQSGD